MLIIVGPTGSGKSTLAGAVTKEWARASGMGIYLLSAGHWVRERLDLWEHNAEATRLLTEETVKVLQDDPQYVSRWLKGKVARHRGERETHGIIVEGIRNPTDFATLIEIEPNAVVVRLSGDSKTVWEQDGLAAIAGMLLTLGVEDCRENRVRVLDNVTDVSVIVGALLVAR